MLTTVIFGALSFAVTVGVCALLVRLDRLEGLLARAEKMTGRKFAGVFPRRLAQAMAALLERLSAQEHRIFLTHSVTGLPTREHLAARMTQDRQGTLALLCCKDYDRLCAFDAQSAERLLLEIVARSAAMLPPGRFLAHVDRAHLAIWIGSNVEGGSAEAEIDALVYALGNRWMNEDREILPEIVTRKVQFDAANASAQAAISQTLSKFSVPKDEPAGCVTELQAQEHFQLEQDLRQAVTRQQLRMQYQPLIDASRQRVCGAEALLRWEHPQRGLISPAIFIPIAERAGLANEIGLWALNHAARDLLVWRRAGLSDVFVAVNVSGNQLETDDLGLLISRVLKRHGLKAEALEIELTESVALADNARAHTLCADLRRQGVRVAIDDFGTGYSSLSALRNLTFDKIKIDRTFVTDVDRRRDSQAICSSLISLARGLGIDVLAEGVESEAEYRWLRNQGCKYFQGFYFAKPFDSAQFVHFAQDPLVFADQISMNEAVTPERIRA